MREGFILGGGVGERQGHRLWVYLDGGRECRTFLCMLTFKWMYGENSTRGSSAGRQIKGVGWGRLEVVWGGGSVT